MGSDPIIRGAPASLQWAVLAATRCNSMAGSMAADDALFRGISRKLDPVVRAHPLATSGPPNLPIDERPESPRPRLTPLHRAWRPGMARPLGPRDPRLRHPGRWIVPDPALRRPFRCRPRPAVGASGPERQPGTRARERGYPQEVAGYVKAGSGPRGKIAEDRVGGGTAATESVITDGRLPSRQSA